MKGVTEQINWNRKMFTEVKSGALPLNLQRTGSHFFQFQLSPPAGCLKRAQGYSTVLSYVLVLRCLWSRHSRTLVSPLEGQCRKFLYLDFVCVTWLLLLSELRLDCRAVAHFIFVDASNHLKWLCCDTWSIVKLLLLYLNGVFLHLDARLFCENTCTSFLKIEPTARPK